MKTGKAYGFMNYEGRWRELAGDLETSSRRANFPRSYKLVILDDKVSTADMDMRVRKKYGCNRKKVPKKIADLAKNTDVYGSIPGNVAGGSFKKLLNDRPVKASGLRFLIMAQAPGVSDSSSADQLGQQRANQMTAGMLKTVLHIVADKERRRGAGDIFKYQVFYQDSHRNAQSI